MPLPRDSQTPASLEIAVAAARAAAEKQAERIVVLDVRKTIVITDYFDVIVHVFAEDARDFYDLERLWSDAPKVTWEEPQPVR